MKKLLVLTFMAVLASTSMALAAVTLTNNATTSPTGPYHSASTDLAVAAGAGPLEIGKTPFTVSTNVTLIADGGLGGFNVSAKHVSGDVAYLSSSLTATITENATLAKGTAMTAILLNTGVNDLYTGAY